MNIPFTIKKFLNVFRTYNESLWPIFTFGILLYSVHRIPWYIIIIPLLWSIVGFSAAMNLGIQEDYGLVIAGLLSAAILLFGKPKPSTTHAVR